MRRSPGPPRERFPPRERDDHPDVEYFGAGESYRPGGSGGDGPYRPGRDRDRDRDRDRRDERDRPSWPRDRGDRDRRDDRRRDERREDIDSYIPPTSYRAKRMRSRSPDSVSRRSRSPVERGRTELFPDRPRSPPSTRRYSPPPPPSGPRSERNRSPIRRRSRSPYNARARSPADKRARDYSPEPRRSPKRERIDSPPRGRYDRPRSPSRRPYSPPRNGAPFRPRSRSPPRRDDRRSGYSEDNWRRRSPSPRPMAPMSTNTSRRSSPPVHPDRLSASGSRTHSPAYAGRSTYDSRRDESYSSRPPRSPRNDYRGGSRDDTPMDDYPRSDVRPAPPTGPRASIYDRPPPSGPSRQYSNRSSPPTGPSSSVAPSGPSGRGSITSGPSVANRGRGGPPRDFVSPPGAMRGRTSLTYRAPGYRPPAYGDAPPAGPRASSFSGRGDFGGSASRGDHGSSAPSRGSYSGYGRGGSVVSSGSITTTFNGNADYAFRANNNSSSTTYPRSQRFNTTQQHLAGLETIVPGGKKLPTGLTTDQEKRMKQLEEDAEKIRSELAEKQKSKREGLNEWEARERESTLAGLRSELADDHLQKLTEEDAIAGAAF